MIEQLTFLEKLSIIGQVFLKIGLNFWPVILIGALVCVGLSKQEHRFDRYEDRWELPCPQLEPRILQQWAIKLIIKWVSKSSKSSWT